MKNKRLIFFCFLFTLIMFTGIRSAYAQRSQNAVKKATWQTSVDDSRRGSVTLGVRDKWGSLGRFTATFIVTAPNGKTFRGQMATTQDEWAYIDFPSQFSGSPRAGGNYKVVFSVNGVVIGRDKFRFRP